MLFAEGCMTCKHVEEPMDGEHCGPCKALPTEWEPQPEKNGGKNEMTKTTGLQDKA